MLGFKVHGMGISGSKDLNKPPFKIDGVTLEWIPSNLKTDSIAVIFYKCPACLKTSIKIEGLGEQFSNNYKSFFYPSSKAKNYPDYVPQAIREDYEEAHKIINLSPKASATLSRRCIQGMIRNVFNVNKRTLAEEINSIKDQVDNKLWSGIDAIRKVGNIGAHMEKNINEIIPIEPSEAEKTTFTS
ncbi:DUF4145 domain-containing protein [Microaceticoccus formicicus]|uniref:DUF4145 domain-containing protein n=1 Tax=Microaceticoccus formicicus TaxID=3118105 RepID=UPI003CD01B9F|nr:DUF4145 domain-containing protein [Peptoniphilaceae bacterium AMB_02]